MEGLMEGLAIHQFESVSQKFAENNTNRSIVHDCFGLRESLGERGVEFGTTRLSSQIVNSGKRS